MPYWAQASSRSGGFTIVELLVGGMVTTLALVAVYTVITQVLSAERTTSLRWQDRAGAAAVVAHLADAIEYGVNPKEQIGMVAEADKEAGRTLTFFTQPREVAGRDPGQGQFQWRRYRWATADGDERSGTLELRAMPFAGTANLFRTGAAAGEGPPSWELVPPLTVATGVSGITVQFQALGDRSGKWVDDWTGPAGTALVRVRARVGGEVAERLVLPRVTGAVGNKHEGGEAAGGT